jgi:hypothetical protein
MPAQPTAGSTAIRNRKPELAHFGIGLFDLRVFRPKGRISRGLSLQTNNRKVLCINPDSTSIKEFAIRARLDREDIERAS